MKRITFKMIAFVLVCLTTVSIYACNDSGTGDNTESESEIKATENMTSYESESIEIDSETETDANTADAAQSETETETETETNSDTESEYTTETETCVHNYSAKPEGHWKPACDICGKGEGRLQSHEIEEKVEDEGDLRLYFGECTVCRYVAYEKEVEYGIRAYVGTSMILSSNAQGFESSDYIFDSGVAYARFTLGNESEPCVCVIENEGEDRTTGKYMVMKIRLGEGLSEIKLSVSTFASYLADTNNKTDRGSASFALKKLPSGWFTVIIDMTKAVDAQGRGYVADAGGEYFLRQFRISPVDSTGKPEGKTLDISYVMLCDTFAEAQAFVSSEKGYYLFENIASEGDPSSSGTVCNHTYTYDTLLHTMNDCEACGVKGEAESHMITESVYDGSYRYECVCGYVAKEKTVPQDINIVVTPNNMVNESDGHVAFTSSELIYSEEGDTFARIWGKSKTDDGRDVTDEVKWYNPLKNNSKISGRYMIIKFRIGENGLGQTYLKMYTSTKNKDATDERDGLTVNVSEDGEWHVIVIDLAMCVGNSQGTTYVENEDGEYVAKFLQIRPFSGSIASEDDYMDIAYIAFDDEIDALLGLVDEDTYYFMSDKGSGAYMNTDGSCMTHGFSEVQEGNTYKYVCGSCGYEMGSKTVEGSVNKFYGVNEVSDSLIDTYMVRQRAKLYDEVSQIAYTRFITASDVMQPAYSRNDRDGESRPVNVGGAEYLVVTLRQSKVSSLAIALGTTVGEADSFNGANLPVASMTEGEWVTFVINIKKVYGDAAWTADSNGNYTLTHFEITCRLDGEGYLDIASYAFCDEWDEIKTVIDTDTVQYMESNNVSEEREPDGSTIRKGES